MGDEEAKGGKYISILSIFIYSLYLLDSILILYFEYSNFYFLSINIYYSNSILNNIGNSLFMQLLILI